MAMHFYGMPSQHPDSAVGPMPVAMAIQTRPSRPSDSSVHVRNTYANMHSEFTFLTNYFFRPYEMSWHNKYRINHDDEVEVFNPWGSAKVPQGSLWAKTYF